MNQPESELIDGIDPEMIEQKPATDHPITDDVMREAERIAEDIQDQNCAITCDDCLKMSATIIARALLAERQRAAEIARKTGGAHLKFAELGLPIEPSKIIAEDRARVANDIANAILAQGEKS